VGRASEWGARAGCVRDRAARSGLREGRETDVVPEVHRKTRDNP